MMTKWVHDGLENTLRAIGTTADPQTATRFISSALSYTEMDSLYSGSAIAAKIIDIPVDDALHKGRYFTDLDGDDVKRMDDAEEIFGVMHKIENAAKWSRLYGGAVILIGLRGQNLAEPLDIDAIRPGELEYLVALDCNEISIAQINLTNISAPNYRMAEYYDLNGVKVHHTRVIYVDGIDAPYRVRSARGGFGLSVLQRCYDDIYRAEHAAQSADAMLWNAACDVLKVPGLLSMMRSTQESDALYNRFVLANSTRNNLSMMILDSTEEMQRLGQQFGGVVDLVKTCYERLSASSDIPKTRLLGASPGGLNSTGDSDAENYDNLLHHIQCRVIGPCLSTLDRLIAQHIGVDSSMLSYRWSPLREMSALQVAEIESKNAVRDKQYIDMGVTIPSIVARQLLEDGVYSAIDDDYIEGIESMVRESSVGV